MSLLLEALRKAERRSLQERAAAAPQAGHRDTAPIALELEAVTESAAPAPPEPPPTRTALDEKAGPVSRPRAIAEPASTGAKLQSPFYRAVGVLATIAVATAGYYWHQMQPAPQLLNSGALPQRPHGTPEASQPHPAKLEIPGLPVAAPAPVIVRDAAALATRAATRSAPKLAATAPASIAPGEASAPARDAARIPPQVATGYAALRDGNFDAARPAYQQALLEEPENPDAVLGMAALETHAGNQFARQGRWAEAQQAYLRALTGDPGNPDIAFNLAVSLDRMHQPVEAIAYYERALALAAHRAVSFPAAAARRRLQQLAP